MKKVLAISVVMVLAGTAAFAEASVLNFSADFAFFDATFLGMYIRSEFLYGLRLANQFEKDLNIIILMKS
jgi:hypothetical protein